MDVTVADAPERGRFEACLPDGTLVDGPAEVPDAVTTVTAVPDGPLLVRGDLRLDLGDAGTGAETRAALCRCGHSANKPFCDGSHERIGWRSGAVTDHEPAGGRPRAEPAVPED